jgi:hypothetical protein
MRLCELMWMYMFVTRVSSFKEGPTALRYRGIDWHREK